MHASRDLDATDPTFKQDLHASERAVWLVARWLQQRGNNVTVRALHVRPSVAEINEYGDAGDLEIVQRLEVKQRGIAFTDATNYPYPTVLVDVAHTWDRAQPKPFAYVILNASATAAAIVEGRTSAHWIKTTRFDRQKQRDRTFYECPVERVKFLPIPAAVRSY